MARITWQDVAAPDFSGSGELLRGFASSMDKGLAQASAGLSTFDKSKSDAVSNMLALKMSTYKDPVQLEADLNTGRVWEGINTSRLSAEDIQAATATVKDLLGRTAAKDALEQGQYAFGRLKGDHQSQDAAVPALAQLLGSAQRRDEAGVAAALAENAGTLGNLRFNDLAKVYTTLGDTQSGALDLAQGNQDYTQDGILFDRDTITHEEGRKVQEYIGAGMQFAEDPEEALGYVNSSDIPAHLRAAVFTGLTGITGMGNSMVPGGDAGPGGGGSLSGDSPRGGSPYDVVLGYGQYGQPPVPLSTMTIGEVIEFGKNTSIPNSRKAGIGRDSRGLLGSSASGAYQITQETIKEIAPKVLGPNWQSQTYSPENQDKIGEVIWNRTGGSPAKLRSTWEGLKNKTDGELRQLWKQGWGTAKGVITQSEGTSATGAVLGRMAQASDDATQATQRDVDNTGRPASRVLQDYADTRNMGGNTVKYARQLIRPGGTFEGGNEDFFVGHINRMSELYKVPPATIARILSRNVKRKGMILGDEGFWEGLQNRTWGSGGARQVINWDGVTRDMKELVRDVYGVSPLAREAGQRAATDNSQQQVSALRQQESALMSDLSRRQRKGLDTRQATRDLAMVQAQLKAAGAARTDATIFRHVGR